MFRPTASVVLLLLVAVSSSVATAFQPVSLAFSSSSLGRDSRSTSSRVGAYPSNDRVVTSGGGIPVVPAGDCLLFDPNVEGMLGGTNNMIQRLQDGDTFVYYPDYLPAAVPSSPAPASPQQVDATTPFFMNDAQAWLLEDAGTIPPVFAKASAPVTATVLGRAKLIGADAPGNIQHVLLQLPPGFHYIEGQSLSVIPPGMDAHTGKPHKPRLYSIASTRYGDLLDGQTVSLCVRQAEYYDPVTNQIDPSKAGVCSSFLCSVQPGTTVQVAGPVGKTMLLPSDPTKDIIMVATGTGIAPFRAFLHRLFMEQTIARHLFQGQAWLILGVPTTSGLLYPQEFAAMQANAAGSDVNKLRIDYAISREMTNAQGGKLYVQDVLAQNADDLLTRLNKGAHIYFCGLKGMMPGILSSLEEVATQQGLDWSSLLSQYKTNGQWHVEVY